MELGIISLSDIQTDLATGRPFSYEQGLTKPSATRLSRTGSVSTVRREFDHEEPEGLTDN